MLVDRVDNPVDVRIVADGHVVGIDQDNLEILVSSILVNPVRVQHTEIAANATGSLFCNTAQISGELQLVDTLILRLTVNNTLVVRSLSATSSDSNTIQDVALHNCN